MSDKVIVMEGDSSNKNEIPFALNTHEEDMKKKRCRTETRNNQRECKVCLRKMRSDNMKGHMRKHRDLYSLDENDMREEIKERKHQYENREERKRLVREIVQ